MDTSPQLSQRFAVRTTPALLVVRGGRVAARQTGAAPLPALRARAGKALAGAAH